VVTGDFAVGLFVNDTSYDMPFEKLGSTVLTM